MIDFNSTWYLSWTQDPSTITLLIGGLLFGLAFLTLQSSKWGQINPVNKCVILSVLAHVVLLAYAYSTNLITRMPTAFQAASVPIRLTEMSESSAPDDADADGVTDRKDFFDQFSTRNTPDLEPGNLAQRQLDDLQVQRLPSQEVSIEQSAENVVDRQIDFAGELATQTPTLPMQLPLDQQAANADLAAQLAPTKATAMPITSPAFPESADKTPATIANCSPAPPTASPSSNSEDASQWLADQLPSTTLERMQTQAEATLVDQLSESSQFDSFKDSNLWQTELASDSQQRIQDLTKIAMGQLNNQSAMVPDLDSNLQQLGASQDTTSGNVGKRIMASSVTNRSISSDQIFRRLGDGQPLPSRYQRRQDRKIDEVIDRGGSIETEQAIANGLKYLASIQLPDGSWNPRQTEGGRELQVLGHDRQGAGAQADTGITGLAMLTFLAAGNSHLEGPYKDTVRKGLEYLMGRQQSNGSMAGSAQFFAQMYCHSMALLAVCEAYSLTGDARLSEVVQRGVNYSVATQNRTVGGWRYRPGESGDMSQFGWQVMAISSAGLAGTQVDQPTERLMKAFLQRHSKGAAGGLAIYRFGEQVSPTMTAEALLCRYLLEQRPSVAMVEEACEQIVGAGQLLQVGNDVASWRNLPGTGVDNVYFWYYGSLALNQAATDPETAANPKVQAAWQAWNQRLQARLLSLQQTDGALQGSWDPNWFLWGGYGGRVYSTSLSNLCLQVYYRYDFNQEESLRTAGAVVSPWESPEIPLNQRTGDQKR